MKSLPVTVSSRSEEKLSGRALYWLDACGIQPIGLEPLRAELRGNDNAADACVHTGAAGAGHVGGARAFPGCGLCRYFRRDRAATAAHLRAAAYPRPGLPLDAWLLGLGARLLL